MDFGGARPRGPGCTGGDGDIAADVFEAVGEGPMLGQDAISRAVGPALSLLHAFVHC